MSIYINSYSLLAIVIFSILVFECIDKLFMVESNKYNYKRMGRFFVHKINNKINKTKNKNNISKMIEDNNFSSYLLDKVVWIIRIRYILITIIFFILVLKCIHRNIDSFIVVLASLLYIITIPRVKIKSIYMPFGILLKKLNESISFKQDLEISIVITQLKNIIVSQTTTLVSLSYMLTKVIIFTKHTRKTFIKTISLLDLGKEDEAKDTFYKELSTTLAKDFAYIFIKYDYLNPKETINQLEVLEERIYGKNISIKNKKQELYSNLLYILPTMLCFLILLNFIKIILNIIMSNSLFK